MDVPEPDALEQRQPVGPEPDVDVPSTAQVSEADALEQAEAVAAQADLELPSPDPEVPEADALEQAHVVPLDEEEAP